jgi:hypothetical protein
MTMPEVEQALRDKARHALQAGSLPRRKADRTWGGPGAGVACGVCGLPVARNETEFEVQFVGDGTLDVFHFHAACFAVWELERGLLERRSALPS